MSTAPPLAQPAAVSAALRARAAHWLDHALRLWCAHGQAANGAFYEALDWTLTPARQNWVRLRVQARQIHVCARAAASARCPQAAASAERGFALLLRTRAASFYGARLPLNGNAAHGGPDLYDQAFVLLACASMAALGEKSALAEAVRLCEMLERAFLAAPKDGASPGFSDAPGGTRGYRQNPHMHLLEAFLALWQASGDAQFLRRADAIIDLFRTRFYTSAPPRLREYFDADWQPQTEHALEPGHYFEWVWLLHGWARAHHAPPPPEAGALFQWAWAHGRGAKGFARHAVPDDGGASDGKAASTPPYARLWQQTEMLRACLCARPAQLEAVAAMLWRHWLATKPLGLWQDCWAEPARRGDNRLVPASTLYHLWSALAAVSGDEV